MPKQSHIIYYFFVLRNSLFRTSFAWAKYLLYTFCWRVCAQFALLLRCFLIEVRVTYLHVCTERFIRADWDCSCPTHVIVIQAKREMYYFNTSLWERNNIYLLWCTNRNDKIAFREFNFRLLLNICESSLPHIKVG